MYKILAYEISGTPVNELSTFKSVDLNGNNPYVKHWCTDATPSGYQDITSVSDLAEFGYEIFNDYSKVRQEIMNHLYMSGWGSLTNDEKDIAIDYHAYDQRTHIVFSGSGINDLRCQTFGFLGTANTRYDIVIDSVTGSSDTFVWSKDNGSYSNSITITAGTEISLDSEFKIVFINSDGHTLGDKWVNFCNVDADTSKVVHLMTTKGMTQQQAQGFLLNQWHLHFQKMVVDANDRWTVAIKEILKYLNKTDASDLFDTVDSLLQAMFKTARYGKSYGDNSNGIMDYMESVNSYVGQGLEEKNYTLNYGTWSMVKDALYKIIIDGEYNKGDIQS